MHHDQYQVHWGGGCYIAPKQEKNFQFWKLLAAELDTHTSSVLTQYNTCYASPKSIVTWYLLNNMAANSHLVQESL